MRETLSYVLILASDVVHQFTDASLPHLPLSLQGISLRLSSRGHLFCCFLLFVFVVVFGSGRAARLVGT